MEREKEANRRLTVLVIALLMLCLVVFLSYRLYESEKWRGIYFRHMMAAEDELARSRVVYFSDDRLPPREYKITITRDEVKAEQVHSVTIPNPLSSTPAM